MRLRSSSVVTSHKNFISFFYLKIYSLIFCTLSSLPLILFCKVCLGLPYRGETFSRGRYRVPWSVQAFFLSLRDLREASRGPREEPQVFWEECAPRGRSQRRVANHNQGKLGKPTQRPNAGRGTILVGCRSQTLSASPLPWLIILRLLPRNSRSIFPQKAKAPGCHKI